MHVTLCIDIAGEFKWNLSAAISKNYTCGPLTYDGHAGTDFAVRGFASVRRGVPGPWCVIRDVMVRDARSVMHRPLYRLRGTLSKGLGYLPPFIMQSGEILEHPPVTAGIRAPARRK